VRKHIQKESAASSPPSDGCGKELKKKKTLGEGGGEEEIKKGRVREMAQQKGKRSRQSQRGWRRRLNHHPMCPGL